MDRLGWQLLADLGLVADRRVELARAALVQVERPGAARPVESSASSSTGSSHTTSTTPPAPAPPATKRPGSGTVVLAPARPPCGARTDAPRVARGVPRPECGMLLLGREVCCCLQIFAMWEIDVSGRERRVRLLKRDALELSLWRVWSLTWWRSKADDLPVGQ